MRPWVKALNSTVDTVKKLAERCGVTIDEKDMAEKVGMTEVEFRACLSGESKVPRHVLADLWPTYEYLLRDQVKADRIRMLKERIAGLQRRAAKDGVELTEGEIARRAGVSPDELKAYLDGSVEVPEGLSQAIFEEFRSDVLRNVIVEYITLHDEEEDAFLDLPDEDEL